MTAYTYSPGKAKTAANFALIGNPNKNFHPSRNMPILFGVNHITAGLTDLVAPDASANNTQSWGASSSCRGASWTGIIDSDSIMDSLPDEYTAWAQGLTGHSFNSPALSLEVGLRSPNWTILPEAHRDAIVDNMATWWAPRVIRHGLVIRYYLDREEIDWLIGRGQKFGFTDHYVLNPANRSDPGLYQGKNTFPRTQFLELVTKKVAALKGASTPAPAPYKPPTTSTKLAIDGSMGPATIRRWQQDMKAKGHTVTIDGMISEDGSQLVAAVQRFLNSKKIRDSRGRALVVDGKGILPNISRTIGPTNTIYALQRYLGTERDSLLSKGRSGAIAALQTKLNSSKGF